MTGCLRHFEPLPGAHSPTTTKEVQLAAEMAGPIQDPWGKTRAGLTATGKIDRRDFGITKDFGPVVSETVHLTIDLELIKS